MQRLHNLHHPIRVKNHAISSLLNSNAHPVNIHMKLFSRKSLFTKGKTPLITASRVFNSTLAKCSHKTTALLRTVKHQSLRRAYSVGGGAGGPEGFSNDSGPKLPLYSMSTVLVASEPAANSHLQAKSSWHGKKRQRRGTLCQSPLVLSC